MGYLLYVGSYTNEIYTLSFDPDAGTLKHISSVTVGFHPSWITSHPTDPSIVYTGLEQEDGKIISVKFNKDGKGAVAGEQPSLGDYPCTLLATGNSLIVGNYASANVVTVPIAADGPQLTLPAKVVAAFEGSGPNQDRQEAPHPHQIVFHSDHEELLVPDLGCDKTRRLTKDENGDWHLRGNLTYESGAGPRHIALYKDILYTVLELSCEVVAHRFPPLPAEPTFLAKAPTQKQFPGPPATIGMLASEILVPTPNGTFPTPYLYLSNRNDPSPEGDIISIYSIADPEKLESVNEVKSGLKHLRGMLFGGPDDKYLVAGGAQGGGVKVFERIDGGKGLKEVGSIRIETPTSFLWA